MENVTSWQSNDIEEENVTSQQSIDIEVDDVSSQWWMAMEVAIIATWSHVSDPEFTAKSAQISCFPYANSFFPLTANTEGAEEHHFLHTWCCRAKKNLQILDL